MREAEMTHLLKPARKYMLQEATNELFGTYRHRFVNTRSTAAVRERHVPSAIDTWLDLHDPTVADRNSEDVGCQVPKCQSPIPHRLAIDIPSLVPNLRCDIWQQAQSIHDRLVLGPEESRSGKDWDQKVDATAQPTLAIEPDRSARHDEVQVRMIVQVSAPGVKHCSCTDVGRADVLRIFGQRNERFFRGFEQRFIAFAGMRTHKGSKLSRDGKRHHEVSAGQ